MRERSALEVFPVDDLLVSDAFHPGNLNVKSQSPRRPGSRCKGRKKTRGVCVSGPSVLPSICPHGPACPCFCLSPALCPPLARSGSAPKKDGSDCRALGSETLCGSPGLGRIPRPFLEPALRTWLPSRSEHSQLPSLNTRCSHVDAGQPPGCWP